MPYRQSIDGCLSSKIGDAGLREDRLAQWLTLLTPRFKALEEQAQDRSLAHFSILSDSVYRFSPFRVKPEDLARFHGTNERIAIANYGEAIQFYQQLLRDTAQPQ